MHPRHQPPTSFTDLPEEILLEIIQHLIVDHGIQKDLISLGLSSRRLYRLAWSELYHTFQQDIHWTGCRIQQYAVALALRPALATFIRRFVVSPTRGSHEAGKGFYRDHQADEMRGILSLELMKYSMQNLPETEDQLAMIRWRREVQNLRPIAVNSLILLAASPHLHEFHTTTGQIYHYFESCCLEKLPRFVLQRALLFPELRHCRISVNDEIDFILEILRCPNLQSLALHREIDHRPVFGEEASGDIGTGDYAALSTIRTLELFNYTPEKQLYSKLLCRLNNIKELRISHCDGHWKDYDPRDLELSRLAKTLESLQLRLAVSKGNDYVFNDLRAFTGIPLAEFSMLKTLEISAEILLTASSGDSRDDVLLPSVEHLKLFNIDQAIESRIADHVGWLTRTAPRLKHLELLGPSMEGLEELRAALASGVITLSTGIFFFILCLKTF